KIFSVKEILGELGDHRPAVRDTNQLVHPEIRGQTRKLQTMILDFLLEGLSLRFGGMGIRAWMRIKSSQLDAVQAKVLQFVKDGVKVDGVIFVWAEAIGPAANRDLFHE